VLIQEEEDDVNTARNLLCSLTVAALGFAATASATTIVVKDEFGAQVQGATVTVSLIPEHVSNLQANLGAPVQAVESAGGYVVSNINGAATIELTHPAYGTLMAKGDFNLPTIELIINANQGGFEMRHLGAPAAVASVAGPGQNVGGDTCALATVIPWASIIAAGGYTDPGTTGVTDNAPVTCGANGSDVFYTFTPATDACLKITTCVANSPADTVLSLKTTANCATNTAIACNDDNCNPIPPGGNPNGFDSTLPSQPVTAGTSYIVQIDNWASTASAAYTLHIQTSTGCPVPLAPCPPGSALENEPNCGINSPPLACAANDTVNGGCNAVPALFSSIQCGQTFCGTYGNCGATRDTDWIQQVQTSLTVNNFCCVGESAASNYGLVAMNGGVNTGACPAVAFAQVAANVPNNVTACVSTLAYPGTWTWFVSTAAFGGTPCGADYQCHLDCVCPTPCGGAVPGSGGTNFDGTIDAGRTR